MMLSALIAAYWAKVAAEFIALHNKCPRSSRGRVVVCCATLSMPGKQRYRLRTVLLPPTDHLATIHSANVRRGVCVCCRLSILPSA